MTRSMTGYGKATAALSSGSLTIEIKTLNGKNCDVNIKSSILPKDKELLVRKSVADALQRGTIDVFLTFEPKADDAAREMNAAVVKNYLSQISSIAADCGIEGRGEDYLAAILRLPEVFDSSRKEVISEEDWPMVAAAFDEALEKVNAYREKEGKALYADVTSRVQKILDLYNKVESLEKERLDAVSRRIQSNAQEMKVKLDPERFEQEMIFYLEKLDINEEKVRLRQHCSYFTQTIDTEENPGRKLGFIIQEMGREINTTGSKANHAGIQKLVVQMKDELEKIREQSMNIL